MRCTRLAPSPTGALHLGNARTFLANWLIARRNGWRIVLRIEDLDGPRIKSGADQQAIDDLGWLGIDWDEGPIYQSTRTAAYESAVDHLLKTGRAYPCVCTRKEVDLAASAPHAEDGSAVYPGTCRGRFSSVEEARRAWDKEPAIRFRVDDEAIEFTDLFAGRRAFDPPKQLGDFVIRKSDGTASYQLAVVVDDAHVDVTDVVRGDDLIDSTPRQIMLYRALGLTQKIPAYTHLPLIVGGDGRRLAKRHGDTRLATYRQLGTTADRLRALLGRWLGIDCGESISPEALLAQFDLARVPRHSITFTDDDDAFLRGRR